MQAKLKTEVSQFAVLLRNISRAELYFRAHPEEPYHAALECRRFLEHLAYLVAKRHAAPLRGKAGAKEELHSFLDRLKNEGYIPEIQSVLADQIRLAGNGVHFDKFIKLSDAEAAIANSKRLADWFENTSASPLRVKTAGASARQQSGAASAVSGDNPNILPFPKPTAPPPERTTPPPLNQHQRLADKSAAEPNRWVVPAGLLALLIVALIGWRLWAHQNAAQTSSRYEAFAQAQSFAVVPGEGAIHVNERSGPGTSYPILRQLDRGAYVTGIGRARGANGISWIQLSDGRGYVKEALLAPSLPRAPAPSVPAKVNHQDIQAPPENNTPSVVQNEGTVSSELSPEAQALWRTRLGEPEPSTGSGQPDATTAPQREKGASVQFGLSLNFSGQRHGERRTFERGWSNRRNRIAAPREPRRR